MWATVIIVYGLGSVKIKDVSRDLVSKKTTFLLKKDTEHCYGQAKNKNKKLQCEIFMCISLQ